MFARTYPGSASSSKSVPSPIQVLFRVYPQCVFDQVLNGTWPISPIWPSRYVEEATRAFIEAWERGSLEDPHHDSDNVDEGARAAPCESVGTERSERTPKVQCQCLQCLQCDLWCCPGTKPLQQPPPQGRAGRAGRDGMMGYDGITAWTARSHRGLAVRRLHAWTSKVWTICWQQCWARLSSVELEWIRLRNYKPGCTMSHSCCTMSYAVAPEFPGREQWRFWCSIWVAQLTILSYIKSYVIKSYD